MAAPRPCRSGHPLQLGSAGIQYNCDFCGACVDVCPTATLMEKPNKWLARTEDYVSGRFG